MAIGRGPGSDRGLAVRTVLAAADVAALYLALVGGIVLLFFAWPSAWPYWLALVVALASCMVAQYVAAERFLLRSVGATLLPREAAPDLYALTDRISALLDVPSPRLALVPSSAMNAFAVGLTPGRATIALTEALRAELTPEELGAVIAHECAHVADRDTIVMTAATVPRTVGRLLIAGDERTEWTSLASFVWTFVWPIGVPFWAVGALLTLAISRYREFAADRGAALVVGAAPVISALRRIGGEAVAVPEEDLRALAGVNALLIVSTMPRPRIALLMDHPPLDQRLHRLESIAREQGRLTA